VQPSGEEGAGGEGGGCGTSPLGPRGGARTCLGEEAPCRLEETGQRVDGLVGPQRALSTTLAATSRSHRRDLGATGLSYADDFEDFEADEADEDDEDDEDDESLEDAGDGDGDS